MQHRQRNTNTFNKCIILFVVASGSLNDATIKEPVAVPVANTRYAVLASVGKCSANAAQTVKVVPYPVSNAGDDVVICYGKTAQLSSSIDGTNFSWSPVNSLINTNTLTPTAGPETTTAYVLTVTSTEGCPKPVNDTVVVNVIPKVAAFAGNDTTAVINQPLQLHASGGDSYQWSPPTYLNNASVSNPIATLPGGVDTVIYHVRVSTEQGCASSDSIKIHLFETKPSSICTNCIYSK